MARGKASVIKTARGKGDQDSSESDIKGVFFDGRKDVTKTQEFDEVTKHHFTPGPSDRKTKQAKVIAMDLHSWMVEYGVDKSVQVVGGDSTNEILAGPVAA